LRQGFAIIARPGKAGFVGRSMALSHHINGVFAAEIRGQRLLPAISRGFAKKARRIQFVHILLNVIFWQNRFRPRIKNTLWRRAHCLPDIFA
jgi:hypothetical protein